MTLKRKALQDLKKKSSGWGSGIGGTIISLMESVMDVIVGPQDDFLSTDPASKSLEQCSTEEDSSCDKGLQEAISIAKRELSDAKRKIKETKESIKQEYESLKKAPKGEDEAYAALRDTCLEYQESS